MEESVLEDIMHRFVHKKIDILVCTTIIESGIDIPNANTIIIDRADRFGLADLYQLRGRVGRSGRKAYALLMLPNSLMSTGDARKRINAINEGKQVMKHIKQKDMANFVANDGSATNDISNLNEMDCLIICVPTPLDVHEQPDDERGVRGEGEGGHPLHRGGEEAAHGPVVGHQGRLPPGEHKNIHNKLQTQFKFLVNGKS